jgi:nucleotide-binding universal stress UspA family protein
MIDAPTVVVGVDGSPGSSAALEFALEEASRRGAELRVITVAHLPTYWGQVGGLGGYAILTTLPTQDEIVADVLVAARQMVDAVIAEHAETAAGMKIIMDAVSGVAGDVLVESARDADMLVVGHRGRGGVTSALLGSVGLHSVLHATCPVTIVRPSAPAAPGDLAALDAAGKPELVPQ